MNFHLIVSVEEGIKTLIGPKVPNINDCITFEDLYKKATLNSYEQSDVEIYGRTDAKSKWIPIEECFDDRFEIIVTSLKFTEIKFKITPSSLVPQHVLQNNPLDIIMQTVQQPQLPQLRRPENNRLDMLYNELIILFQEKNVGWKGGLHIDIGKAFIERLTQILWYIDPHLPKFKKRGCNLPQLFTELPTYSQNQNYNQYFHNSNHKKIEVSQEKLTSLVKSLDSYLVQPWAFNSQWADVISAILELLQIIHKYIGYLKQVNMAMERVHSSTILVRDGTSNISVEIIDWCEEVNSIYNELESLLKEKQYYEFVDLEPYLPTFIMDRHRFIKNIKLGISICLYRYYCGNYLGAKNFVWKIPNDWDERSETRNAQTLVTIRDIIPQYFSREMRKNMLKKVIFQTLIIFNDLLKHINETSIFVLVLFN